MKMFFQVNKFQSFQVFIFVSKEVQNGSFSVIFHRKHLSVFLASFLNRLESNFIESTERQMCIDSINKKSSSPIDSRLFVFT